MQLLPILYVYYARPTINVIHSPSLLVVRDWNLQWYIKWPILGSKGRGRMGLRIANPAIWYNAMNVNKGPSTPPKNSDKWFCTQTRAYLYLILVYCYFHRSIWLRNWEGKYPRIFGRGGAKYPRIFGRGMPSILGFLAGGAKYLRIFGRGCQIS